MSKKIGVIAEDASDVAVINEIFEKYMPSSAFTIKQFIGKGCGKLKSKCAAWAKVLSSLGCEHILVFHDLDRNSEIKLRKTLTKQISKEKYPNSIIIIPIEELEAWLLSDPKAIKAVFNLKKAPKTITNCEAIESPKEHLRDIVWTLGKKRYLNTTHNQKIARNSSVSNFRRCKSYCPLHKYILENICA